MLDRPQQKTASSLLEGRITWFFSSCSRSLSSYYWDLRDPLVWPQERPVSMRVTRGLSGFLSSRCRVLSPRLELRPEPEFSSPALTCILGFLWSLHRGVRPRLEWRHASLFLPRCSSSVRLPSELTRGSVSFPRGATGLSHVSLWCESILTVTVVAMQGNQVHLKLTETFGCLLEWWHDPWSSFIWR